MKNVAIYGKGTAGGLVFDLLSKKDNYSIKAFFDDKNDSVSIFKGIKVYNSNYLEKFILKHKITDLVIAVSRNSFKIREKLFKLQLFYNINIFVVPLQNELINNILNFHDIRKYQDYDFFIPRINKKLNLTYSVNSLSNRIIMVTGGAGSIGSELIYQLIKLNVKKIVLIDSSEYNLYKFSNYISNLNLPNLIKIKTYLLNLTDKKMLKDVILKEKPSIIYHAAAYKHVLITEENILFSLKNNVISLDNILKSIQNTSVDKFVLISTDKAVNPTTIMGLSKKISEEIIRFYSLKNSKITYSIVRFGNVVGSSGSVFPRFIDIIKNNDVIKITDKEVERYMMSISEAARLVITASLYSKESFLYVLNMGKPIKILSIAKKIALLFNKKIVFNHKLNKSNNTILVKFTGLNNNEKLSEKLIQDSEFIYKRENEFIVVKKLKYDYANFSIQYKNFIKDLNKNNYLNLDKYYKFFTHFK
jgi:UDP-N-acetyl-D-glucosamine 4,6-dehydratase